MRGPLLPLLIWAVWFNWLPNPNNLYLTKETQNTTSSNLFCTGNLGENILPDGDFGTGNTNILPVDPGLAPGYTYQLTPPPDDGFYTITNNTSDWTSFANIWVDIGDNSPDPNGYMMVVNANVEPDVFFERTVDICDNTVYEFSADVINLVEPWVENYILPNMDFLIDGEVLFSTGDVPQDGTWKTFGFTFAAEPGATQITLTLRNNAPGGFGNDLALDNISFRPCGPSSAISANPSCSSGAISLTLSAEVEGSEDDFVYQWQESTDGIIWQDLENEDNASLFLPNPIENFQYRYLLATSVANLNNPICRFVSDVYISDAFAPVTTPLDTTICEGSSITIGTSVYTENGSYSDTLQTESGCDSIILLTLQVESPMGTGLEEVICAGSSYTLGDQTYTEPGFYLDTLVSTGGCDSIVSLDLTVLEPVNVSLSATVCEGEGVTIGDTTYFDTGEYTTVFTALNGCDSTIQLSLTALDTSLVEMELTLCAGETFQGQSYSENTTLNLVETGLNGCDSTTLVHITVSDLVDFEIEGETVFCAGESTVLNAGNQTTYLWSTGEESATIIVDSTGSFSVTVTDELGCEAEASVQVEEAEIVVEANVQEPTCYGESDAQIEIVVLSGDPDGYEFSIDGEFWQSYPVFQALSSGEYLLQIKNQYDCTSEETLYIPETEEISLELGEDLLISLSDSTQLQAFTNFEPASIKWEPEMGLSCTDCLDPMVGPMETTAYRLVLSDANGCTTADQITIFVEKTRAVFVPNAFSPNGDGINDTFTIFAGNEVEQITSFKIFDRWGALLYDEEGLSPSNMMQGWDGSFNGKQMAAGVYVYVAEVLFVDGQAQVYSGDVALIK